MRAFVIGVLLSVLVSPALAETYETRIPLRDGRLQTAALSAPLLEKLNLKGMALSAGSIDLRGLRGNVFINAVNASLGEGCSISMTDDEIVLRTNPKLLPHSADTLKTAARIFAATAAPDATANQRRFYGLMLPPTLPRDKSLVVLVHGLDCNRTNWEPMAQLLRDAGHSVAYFTYPSDGPLEDSAALLASEMETLRKSFPEIRIDILAHSMGGLVARRYVEGSAYAGGVDHLILLGTPNMGSRWATYRWALEAQEHYGLWKHEEAWRWTWMITDGLGEAGRDLKPSSKFLTSLNSCPRRDGVQYTIVAGNRNQGARIAAKALDRTANVIPAKLSSRWGFRQAAAALHRQADKLEGRDCTSDGPVNLAGTCLEGVDDYTILPADHTTLYYPSNGREPAAWPIIRDRLAR